MKIIGSLTRAKALVLDVDNTIYPRTDAYLAEGTRGEMAGVAEILGITPEEATTRVERTRSALAKEKSNGKATMTEAVYRLGVSAEQWSQLRLKAWRPETWIKADDEITTLFTRLSQNFLIAFGTNSPAEIGRRVVRLVGIREGDAPDARILGPENLGVSKPDPRFFSEIAKLIQIPAGQCISIGDREFSDGPPAIEAGYAGAIIAPGSRDELLELEAKLIQQ